MALTSLQGGGRGISFDDYFKQALNFDISKLEAIIRGQDHSMPIVAAMAAYEVKKPMVTAATGQQAQQQLQQAQPTVRQEMEQEMDKSGMIPDMAMLNQQRMGPQPPVLPEQAGVGALPAPNMQGMAMAHGGIIAFEDGGYVPGYAGDDLFARSDVDEDEVAGLTDSQIAAIEKKQNAWLASLNKERGRGSPPVGGLPEKTRKFLENKDKEKRTTKGRAGVPIKDTSIIEEIFGPPTPSPNRPSASVPATTKQMTGKTPTELKASNAAINAALAEQPTFTNVSSRSAAPAQKPAGIAAVAPKEATTSDMVTEALRASDRLGGGAESEYKAGLANYGAEVNRRLEELAAERERGKPEGQAYSKYEQSLLADEAAAKGKEERNLQMALVDAGLAIAGGTSRYALENIGKGALVGTKQYREGLDKLEAAAKERQKAMAMIEQERRAEARGDWKDKNEFAAKRAEFLLNAKKFGVEGLAKVYDVKTRTATDIFNNMEQNKTRMEVEREQSRSRERVAKLYSEGRGDVNERMLMASAQSAAEKEYAQWAADGLNKAKSAAEKELKKREIFNRVFDQFKLPSPYAAGAAPQSGQRKPLAERTDLFQ